MSFKFNGKKTGLFAAGVLFGTAGLKVLSSDDAKKFYTNCTAAVLRAKKCVMKTVYGSVIPYIRHIQAVRRYHGKES